MKDYSRETNVHRLIRLGYFTVVGAVSLVLERTRSVELRLDLRGFEGTRLSVARCVDSRTPTKGAFN